MNDDAADSSRYFEPIKMESTLGRNPAELFVPVEKIHELKARHSRRGAREIIRYALVEAGFNLREPYKEEHLHSGKLYSQRFHHHSTTSLHTHIRSRLRSAGFNEDFVWVVYEKAYMEKRPPSDVASDEIALVRALEGKS